MSGRNRRLGEQGEALAAAYLEREGYVIEQRGYRCPAGEIDLVARRGALYVFVEVKTRRSRRFGLPEESITPRKQAHLIAAAQTYLQAHGVDSAPWRIDAVAVELDPAGRVSEIRQIENAVRL